MKKKRMRVGNDEYMLSQFTDDTTQSMGGSLDSLQAALHILKIFGGMLGFKIKTKKMKLILTGRKTL